MLKHRILTAIIALPLLLMFVIFAKADAVFMFFLVCAALSVYEVANMFLPALAGRIISDRGQGVHKIWIWFCVGIAILLFFASTVRVPGAERGGIVLAIVILLVVGTFSARTIDRSIVNMAGCLLSVCYGCLPWLSVWDLYLLGHKASHIMIVLSIVMMADTGGYFVGKRFGQTKLAPNLSPKKTWEGFVGGVVASMIGVQVVNAIYGFAIAPWWVLALCALLGSIAGVLGDLLESAFKRFAQVKDSGAIFPGHGGFLDRTDSLLVAAPVVWGIFYLFQSFSA